MEWFTEVERQAGIGYCAVALAITVLLGFPGGWMFLMGSLQVVAGWLMNQPEAARGGAKWIMLGLPLLLLAGVGREYLLPRFWQLLFPVH